LIARFRLSFSALLAFAAADRLFGSFRGIGGEDMITLELLAIGENVDGSCPPAAFDTLRSASSGFSNVDPICLSTIEALRRLNRFANQSSSSYFSPFSSSRALPFPFRSTTSLPLRHGECRGAGGGGGP
jgi:hypothetical protein